MHIRHTGTQMLGEGHACSLFLGSPAPAGQAFRGVEGEGGLTQSGAQKDPQPCPGMSPDAAEDSQSKGWDQPSIARNPSALAATRAKQLTCPPAMGSRNVCPTAQLMSWSDTLNRYFCTIFERCYATCQMKGDAEGKEEYSCRGCGGAESFCSGSF